MQLEWKIVLSRTSSFRAKALRREVSGFFAPPRNVESTYIFQAAVKLPFVIVASPRQSSPAVPTDRPSLENRDNTTFIQHCQRLASSSMAGDVCQNSITHLAMIT